MTENTTAKPTDAVPDGIDSASAKLVYLYLSHAGETGITTLSSALGMRKLSLYSVLDTLTERGLVQRRGETYAPAA